MQTTPILMISNTVQQHNEYEEIFFYYYDYLSKISGVISP